MSDHYYSQQPGSEHDRRLIETSLSGVKLSFITDAGVFSKGGLDEGSALLIEQFEAAPGARIADVGCGYGPIGLYLAKRIPESAVTMLDMNERALDLARENAARNGITGVRVLASDGLQAVKEEKFDAIATNPPIRAGKATVHRIFEEAHDCLEAGGALWVVIRTKQGAPSAKRKLESMFEQVDERAKNKGYRIYRAIK
ncbi:class I SAM-dependent methyltransferase [Xylanibacillus composti]|uniref:Class I SAM-dependent methyltransferase n=1 Tax=Xylanibacillus composti TaxID=1572762 RepID=A0A8J4M3Q5_9BACL|nr:class I SAM-dependent methyltransferase [Xylanibacillus composti]GIQ70327.1 class I SAM-dependent methyltransferase [Xylanibacillus composti]